MTEKLSKRSLLKEDLREHSELYDLSWPTLFEAGTGWNNSIARQYDIEAIPSIWVIDPQGRVASLNAWGKQLTETIEELSSLSAT